MSQREKRLQVHTENEGGGSGADSKSIHIQRLDIRQHSGRQITEGVVVVMVMVMLVVMDQSRKSGKRKEEQHREREERKREYKGVGVYVVTLFISSHPLVVSPSPPLLSRSSSSASPP